MTQQQIVRLIRNEYELRDVAEKLNLATELIERDFALTTIAVKLVEDFGDRLCFKGGFVLRHVYGHERFSKDIDATRINPPKNKLDVVEVADSIAAASVTNLMTFSPGEPASNSRESMDFDGVTYRGPLGSGVVAVEVSYREGIVLDPEPVAIDTPYYEAFTIPAMKIDEIVSEKLRTLAQRNRPPDLADLAMILARLEIDDATVRDLTKEKFRLVKQGDHIARITENIESMGSTYGGAVPAVAPDAPSYEEAKSIVLGRIGKLFD